MPLMSQCWTRLCSDIISVQNSLKIRLNIIQPLEKYLKCIALFARILTTIFNNEINCYNLSIDFKSMLLSEMYSKHMIPFYLCTALYWIWYIPNDQPGTNIISFYLCTALYWIWYIPNDQPGTNILSLTTCTLHYNVGQTLL